MTEGGARRDARRPAFDAPAVPLLEPRDGLPPVVEDAAALAATVAALAAGTGPFAVDAERASGYRYGQRAYLVQLRRAGAGTALIDPIGCPDLSALSAALADTEWVLHAASQDLPCLRGRRAADRGAIFDTELGARLAGHARVGLGPLVEEVLGLALEKGHSAADWSTRPLPEPWLRYAALDVEVLVELRDALHAELIEQGKLEWARRSSRRCWPRPGPAPRVDPWRRTSGLHRVRGARGLAAVRSLWYARDELAQQRDTAPGRVLADTAIVEAALARPKSLETLFDRPRVRRSRRPTARVTAGTPRSQEAYALPDSDLPPTRAAQRRAAAGSVLAGARPGSGGPARGEPYGCRRDRRRAPAARGEPALPRHGPSPVLDTTRRPRRGRPSPRSSGITVRGRGRSASPHRSWPRPCGGSGTSRHDVDRLTARARRHRAGARRCSPATCSALAPWQAGRGLAARRHDGRHPDLARRRGVRRGDTVPRRARPVSEVIGEGGWKGGPGPTGLPRSATASRRRTAARASAPSSSAC